MQLFKAFCIIFVLHLIPILYVVWLAANYSEAGNAWLLFLILDFPLSWLFIPIEPLIHVHSIRYDLWNLLLAPALIFQFLGCIHWLLIYMLVRFVLDIIWFD
jgi:hypothetical protein